ncbi:helix-turn-helix domain-containing protein [Streptomyces laurentii]|uniref:Helix-turn-helix domain-containing protein n=1 Tax=Streptomyces laurentii TaxID=39478 RepID=A0A160P049_STRLU|nr:helix-turn-helix domain-containing protein [Streptomyces laurentii]
MTTDPATLLRVLVAQRQWRYRDFATVFGRAAERLGFRGLTVSEAQFRRWTSGRVKTLPGPEACRVLEDLFGLEAAALFGPPPEFPAAATEAPTPFDIESEIAMTARDAADEAGSAAAQSVSDTTIDQLRDDLAALARAYSATSPFEAFRRARQLRAGAEHHRGLTQVPAQQQELLILCGQSCSLLSTAAFDLGVLDESARLARAAVLYGETARFDPLRAYATGSLAVCAYFADRPGDAVRHVRTALAFGGLGDTARRRLLSIEARAHGHLGDRKRAVGALAASLQQDTGARDLLHDDVGGEFGFPEERLVMSNGTTALLVGDTEGAEKSARRALEIVVARPAARAVTVQGKAAADLASARVLRGDLDGAAESLETVWEIPGEWRSAGLLQRVVGLRVALTAPAFRGARLATELGERIEDFRSRSAPRTLGTDRGLLALES